MADTSENNANANENTNVSVNENNNENVEANKENENVNENENTNENVNVDENVENNVNEENNENNNENNNNDAEKLAALEAEIRSKVEQELIGQFHARNKALKSKSEELEAKLNDSNRKLTIFTIAEEKGVSRDILQKMEGSTAEEIIANAELLIETQNSNKDSSVNKQRKIENKFHNNANVKNRREEIMKLLK